MPDITLYAIPVFLGGVALEAALAARENSDAYDPRDTAASLAMGAGNVVITLALRGATFALFFWLYERRLFEIGSGAPAWVLLFFVEDFTYYWWHRASHEVRFLWAAHVNHHSSQRYNLSTALRQSWTTPLTGLLFYWPLPLLGFHPAMLAVVTSVSLLYQFWLHTERIGRLGPLERVLNTPSHHRVHHGSNLKYLDRNHGGILIVWDRLFGSFEPEVEPVRYGLTRNIETHDPLRIAFHEWVALFRDLGRATSWRARLGYALGPPGFSPDGSSRTSRELRALGVGPA
jgi:sterol desaturase/sphingolipid hydroxylase (fatty acid hydroxylase superfamily)